MSDKKKKIIIVVLMIVAVSMTASPIVILSNSIDPYVLGLPFFFFWNILWPSVLFILSLLYIKVEQKSNKKGDI